MNREEIIKIISEKMKLLRTEYNYTQEQMSELIGISKKTLVQIEKQRVECGWTIAIAVCTLFRNSAILQATMGGDPQIFISLIMNDGFIKMSDYQVNDKLWWRTIENQNNWRLQQNLVHKIFRIVNPENKIKFYTLSYDTASNELQKNSTAI